MIDLLIGVVKIIKDKIVTVLVGGVGFVVITPRPGDFVVGQEVEICTYLHWSSENGFSLYGFSNELERTIFLMVIDCPKIGPSIALSILSKIGPVEFLHLISAHDDKGLSTINGIGPRKAEQLIVALRHKVTKLLASGDIVMEKEGGFTELNNVSQVLMSLNYSKQEISKVISYLAKKYKGQGHTLDQLIRSALSFLSSIK